MYSSLNLDDLPSLVLIEMFSDELPMVKSLMEKTGGRVEVVGHSDWPVDWVLDKPRKNFEADLENLLLVSCHTCDVLIIENIEELAVKRGWKKIDCTNVEKLAAQYKTKLIFGSNTAASEALH